MLKKPNFLIIWMISFCLLGLFISIISRYSTIIKEENNNGNNNNGNIHSFGRIDVNSTVILHFVSYKYADMINVFHMNFSKVINNSELNVSNHNAKLYIMNASGHIIKTCFFETMSFNSPLYESKLYFVYVSFKINIPEKIGIYHILLVLYSNNKAVDFFSFYFISDKTTLSPQI